MLLLLHPPQARRNPRSRRFGPVAAVLNPVNVPANKMADLSAWPGVITPAYPAQDYAVLDRAIQDVQQDIDRHGMWTSAEGLYPYSWRESPMSWPRGAGR